MIEHVYRQARQSKKLNGLIVACDDPGIKACVEAIGGEAVLTRNDHPNGTSRIAEVARAVEADVFINIQGDEPLIHPANVDLLADLFAREPGVQVATLAVRKSDAGDYENPGVVKVVCDARGDALYFSRAPIPYFRDGHENLSYLKHLGIYGYRRDFLLKFVTWETGILEHAEKLEQLRILERGFKIRVLETLHDSLSVDTLEDLEEVEKILSHSGTARSTGGSV
jgi:3-deoxy-manno-octulosonate cytidylyltransferase (CMP-KDO synthetase)